jgi:hypothetical protein
MKCPSCGYENSEDAEYCNLCQHSFVKAESELRGLAPLAELRREGVPAVRTLLRGGATGENWFQRHLNWTWLLPQLLLYVAALVVMFGFIASMGPTLILDPTARPSVLPSLPFSIFVVSYAFVIPLLGAASIWGIGAWVLKRKSRSLWWLLIFLIPVLAAWLNVLLGLGVLIVVWIIFLRLENRSELPGLPVSDSARTILEAQSNKYGP